LNPTILRQVRAFALAVSPSETPAVHRRGYRASGLVLTSTRDVAQTSQMRKERSFADSLGTREIGSRVERQMARASATACALASVGVAPNRRRKVRLKYERSLKPASNAIVLTDL
jgi:hypothetical protein